MGSRTGREPSYFGVCERAIVARRHSKTNRGGWDVEQTANIVHSFFKILNLTMVQDICKPQKCR
jgi:hypothetical protein